MSQRILEQLSPDECFGLVASTHVGRLVYIDELGPVALPFNYAAVGREIIFRVEASTMNHVMSQAALAFEVDHVDEEHGTGWSVLLRGSAAEVPIERVSELLHRAHGEVPKPWAAGIHNTWIRLSPETVTGRRLGEKHDDLSY
ncbi:pyridoxamine 5'-phosphate oxidase family protein [Jatrophihabitans sp. DSM 45814]